MSKTKTTKAGLWNEKTKSYIKPSGTVKQGRRPMFKAFDKAPCFPSRYDANGNLRKTKTTKAEMPQSAVVESEHGTFEPQAQHSPKCKGVPHYYDGALGYEAMKCDVCGYELDLNAEANAKATAERLAAQPQAHSPLPWQNCKDGIYTANGFDCIIESRHISGKSIEEGKANARLIVASVNHAATLQATIDTHQATIDSLCNQLLEARNHAQALAEALKETLDALFNETGESGGSSYWIGSVKRKARKALAAWEGGQQ